MKKLIAILCLTLATVAQAGFVTLAWDPAAGALGYRVYWGTQSRSYTRSNDVGPVLTTTVTGLVNTLTYYFSVTAYNAVGESDHSLEVSTTIPPLPPPEVPQMLNNAFSWSYPITSDTLTGFRVSWKENGARRSSSATIPNPAAWFYYLTGLVPGSYYSVWAEAYTKYLPDGQRFPRTIFSTPTKKVYYQAPWTPPGVTGLMLPEFFEDGSVRLLFFGPTAPEILASHDLRTWESLGVAAQVHEGQFQLFDPVAAVQKFYRVRP